MEFSDLQFLYLFLPAAVLVYYLMPDLRRKNLVLLAAGLLFYAMGQPHWLVLVLAQSYLNWRLGFEVKAGAIKTLILPVVLNLAVLLALRMVSPVLAALEIDRSVPLPLGLGFYTLTVISYHADIFRGKIRRERSFLDFLLYLTLLPKLSQGPILRYDQAMKQIKGRKGDPRQIFEGVQRFCVGLAKKVLLADHCALIIASMDGNGDQVLVGAWLSAVLFLFRIYFECSGFADMAIGMGKIFGFRLPENYDLPYTALSVTDFCSKWHLTLGEFLRDYVQKPLDDQRQSAGRHLAVLLAVCVLGGLWHGVTLNFVMLGVYFFVVMAVESLLEEYLTDLPDVLRNFLTMLLVLFGFVIFAHPDLTDMAATVKAMFGFSGFAVTGIGETVLNSIPLLFACWIGSSSLPRQLMHIWNGICGMNGKQRRDDSVNLLKVVHTAVSFGFICLLLWMCTMALVKDPSVPSIFSTL